MTDVAIDRPPEAASRLSRLLPDRLLGNATLLLLAIVVVALFRGRAHWGAVPWPVWAHLATVMPALALTPMMLAQPKGDRRHRLIGYAWVMLMAATALISFAVTTSNPGHFSFVHIISAWVLVMLAVIVRAARAHRIASHRARIRGLVIGGLLIAGFFTLPFGRMLGAWLTG